MGPIRTREELEALYDRHVNMVYQICLMLLKNVPDAEDATQTVFRKVMEYQKPFRDPEHEKAWLIVTARNECKNQLRHWWNTRRESPEALEKLTYDPPDSESGELRRLIWELPEKYRLALYLHYYQGYSTQEIGKLLGQEPAAAAVLLMACAFTVVTGLDQRILSLLGGSAQDEELLAPGFTEVDLTSTAENGAAIHVSQMLTDRYNVILLGELTAPEGTVLGPEDYYFYRELTPLDAAGQASGEFSGGLHEMRLLEDGDPSDNHMTFLLWFYLSAYDLEADRFRLSLDDLGVKGDTQVVNGQEIRLAPPVVSGHWEFEFPMAGEPLGSVQHPDQPLAFGTEELTISEIRVTPVMLLIKLGDGQKDVLQTSDCYYQETGTIWWNTITLQDRDGNAVPLDFAWGNDTAQWGDAAFYFSQILDPAQFDGGSVTILGQTFPLDSLVPAE